MKFFDRQKEQERLEKKLSRVGKPTWYATQAVKSVGKLVAVLYALNAGVQTMTLLQSEAYHSRERIAKNAYVVLEDLKSDSLFQGGVETYLRAKALTKPELQVTLNRLEEDIYTAKETQDEFIGRVQKIYNPLAVIGMH